MKKQSLRKRRALKLIGLAIAGTQFWGLGSSYAQAVVDNDSELNAAITSSVSEITITGDFTVDSAIPGVTRSVEILGVDGLMPTVSIDGARTFNFSGTNVSEISGIIFNKAGGSSAVLINTTSGHEIHVENSEFNSFTNRAIQNAVADSSIVDSKFTGNSSSSFGGAIHNTNAGTGFRLEGNTFDSNQSTSSFGGAVYTNAANSKILGNRFEGNSSRQYGGAMYNNAANVEVSKNIFISNESTHHNGGGFSSDGVDLVVVENEFEKNIASQGGGGALSVNGARATVKGNIFTDNEANLGGGSYTHGGSVNAKYFDNIFAGNKALGGTALGNIVDTKRAIGSGGAVYHAGNNGVFEGNLFENNTASADGGAIYLDNSTVTTSAGDSTIGTPISTAINGGNVFKSNHADGNGGAIYNSSKSTLTLNAISTEPTTTSENIIFEGNTDGSGNNDIYLADNAILNIKGTGIIYFGGGIRSSNGTSKIEKTEDSEVILGEDSVNEDFTGEYNQTDGILTNHSTSFFGGTNTISNSDLNLWQAADLTIGNLTLNNSNVDSLDGVITKTTVGTFAASGINDFKIDIDGNKGTSDTFELNGGSSTGTFNISEILVSGAPTKEEIPLQVFDGGAITGLTFDESVNQPINTPIYSYGFRSDGSGQYTLFRGALNDQALRGQVAMVSSYQNQLSLNGLLFEHVYLDGSIWFKPYGASETLYFTQDVKAESSAYGGIVGVDFKTVEFKNGGKFLPTIYAAYNGGKQSFSDVDMHQNGGQAGFRGVYQKGNYTGTALAYAGGYSNKMAVAGTVDRTSNWFAGVAVKNAYDFHTSSSEHLVLRPSLAVSYNAYGRQSWTSEFGEGVGMGTGRLDGVNIAPGMSFVYEKDTWSAHLTAQYVYNINDKVSGNVEGAELPALKMRQNYFEYGLGATKKWRNNRLMSQGEILFRDGGRAGVGYQLGVSIKF